MHTAHLMLSLKPGPDSVPDQSQLGDLCAHENETALLTEHEDLQQ